MRALVAVPLLVLGAGCAHLPLERNAPLGPPVAGVPVEQVPVRGHPVRVEFLDGSRKVRADGELLAASADGLWLERRGVRLSIHRSQLLSVELVDRFPSGALTSGVWTGVGVLTTLSHGIVLLLSAPIWLLVGGAATAAAAHANDDVLDLTQLVLLPQYARYPQGLPGTQPEVYELPSPPPLVPASPLEAPDDETDSDGPGTLPQPLPDPIAP